MFDFIKLIGEWIRALPLARIFGVAAGVSLLHLVYFIFLPKWAIRKYRGSDPDRLRRYLERVANTPSPLGSGGKILAHHGLAGLYLERGEHAAAASHFRSVLNGLSRVPTTTGRRALEANIRILLADCLEALNQTDEAAVERRRAAAMTDGAAGETLHFRAKGTLFEQQNRFEEAYAAHLQALEHAPPSDAPVRIACILHLILAAYNSGRPEECVRWASEAIALGATDRSLFAAHRMAGVACGELGRLEESEEHYRMAYEVAASANNRADMGDLLANLADCLCKRGRLAEANEACANAAAMDPKAARMSLATQANVLRMMGRYDESLAALARFKATQPNVIPRLERRVRAVCALEAARFGAEGGRTNESWTHIQEACAEFKGDPKLGLNSEATLAWVLALRGVGDESKSLADRLEPQLAAFERDPSTCRGVLYSLGMAACARGDHEAGIDLWTRYLSLNPDPVYRPTAHYYRGECQRQLDRLAEARSDFAVAVAMELDTHHTRCARQRITGLTDL